MLDPTDRLSFSELDWLLSIGMGDLGMPEVKDCRPSMKLDCSLFTDGEALMESECITANVFPKLDCSLFTDWEACEPSEVTASDVLSKLDCLLFTVMETLEVERRALFVL